MCILLSRLQRLQLKTGNLAGVRTIILLAYWCYARREINLVTFKKINNSCPTWNSFIPRPLNMGIFMNLPTGSRYIFFFFFFFNENEDGKELVTCKPTAIQFSSGRMGLTKNQIAREPADRAGHVSVALDVASMTRLHSGVSHLWSPFFVFKDTVILITYELHSPLISVKCNIFMTEYGTGYLSMRLPHCHVW